MSNYNDLISLVKEIFVEVFPFQNDFTVEIVYSDLEVIPSFENGHEYDSEDDLDEYIREYDSKLKEKTNDVFKIGGYKSSKYGCTDNNVKLSYFTIIPNK